MDYQTHRTTLHNYAALIASKSNISITIWEIPNICTPYTADKSLISAVALLCVISATHYGVVSETISDVEKNIRKNSIGVKKLHKVVTKIYGNLRVFPIIPVLTLSTDDTVDYIFEEKGSGNGSFRSVSSKENTNSGTQ